MKTLATLVTIVCLSSFNVFGQQSTLQLSLKEKSDEPTSKTEHYYLFEIKNNSRSSETISLSATNISCLEVDSKGQENLYQDVLNISKSSKVESLTLAPNMTYEFYIKIHRPNNTKLNTWNCTEVVAVSKKDNSTSNAIIIKTFIPNPKDFN